MLGRTRPDADADGNAHGNADTNTDGNADPDADPDADRNANTNTNTDTDTWRRNVYADIDDNGSIPRWFSCIFLHHGGKRNCDGGPGRR